MSQPFKSQRSVLSLQLKMNAESICFLHISDHELHTKHPNLSNRRIFNMMCALISPPVRHDPDLIDRLLKKMGQQLLQTLVDIWTFLSQILT